MPDDNVIPMSAIRHASHAINDITALIDDPAVEFRKTKAASAKSMLKEALRLVEMLEQ